MEGPPSARFDVRTGEADLLSCPRGCAMADETAGRIEGIGGVFFKARHPEALREWYAEHLGIPNATDTTAFWWRHDSVPERRGHTVWEPFPDDTTYFGPGDADWMINYRVDDLDAALTRLRAEGVNVDDRREDSEFGRFGWAFDEEGNRFELWEPPPGQ